MAESNAMDVDTEVVAGDEYEEVLVYVDFPDFDDCVLLNDGTTVELNDLAGPNPSCKINDLHFSGEHEINLGSQLFFEHTSNTVEFKGQSVNVVKFRLSSIGK